MSFLTVPVIAPKNGCWNVVVMILTKFIRTDRFLELVLKS